MIMYPNALLAKILELALIVQTNEPVSDSHELAVSVLTLNDYLMRGGFLPSVWTAATVAESDITRDPED
jgi:hypothetical protein